MLQGYFLNLAIPSHFFFGGGGCDWVRIAGKGSYKRVKTKQYCEI